MSIDKTVNHVASSVNNASDAINHLIDKAGAALSDISNAIASHAPKAWALAVQGTFAQGIADLIIGSISLLMLLTFVTIFIKFVIKAAEADEDNNSSVFVASMLVCIPSGIVSVILFFTTISYIFDSVSWAKVISPDGYIAQQLLLKALGQ